MKPSRDRRTLLFNLELVTSECTADVLIIRDVGPWEHHATITNAADEVVAFLTDRGHLPHGRRLLYYDSDGRLDEMMHHDGQFLGFAPGPVRGKR